MLESAVNNTREFASLDIRNSQDRTLHFSLIGALVSNYLLDPKKIESLLVLELKNDPSKEDIVMAQIELGIIRDQLNFKGWDKQNLKLLSGCIVKAEDLDYRLQKILYEIVKEDFKIGTNVFLERMSRDPRPKKKSNSLFFNRYDAIPYHIDEGLVDQLQMNESFSDFLRVMIDKMVGKPLPGSNILYCYKVAEFCHRAGGEKYRSVQKQLIDSGEEENLWRAAHLLLGIESPDLDICFDIVEKTDDEEIWAEVSTRIYSTGVVSGEYGIRDSYQSKLNQIKEIVKNRSNKRVKAFGKKIVKSLEESIKHEEKRVQQDLLLRKIEFEG